jgi:hypothetical protein
VKRFKAYQVQVRQVDGVANAVQEVEGLKRVAAVLRGSGLVQVDEVRRTFGMHKLLQQAVGIVLGWRVQCQRMRQLLHARCGCFGDEFTFDAGLYGVMREIAAAAVDAVRRLKEEGEETDDMWCSGMLLRLCDVAKELHGSSLFFQSLDVFSSAAHESLVADLVLEEAKRGDGASAVRHMTLQELVFAAPHVHDVVACDPESLQEQVHAAPRVHDVVDVVACDPLCRFDLQKCLGSHWGRAARALLLTRLVRAHVQEEGDTSLPMHKVVAVPLIQDVAVLGQEHDVAQLLHGARGLRVVDDGGGGCSVEVEEEAEAAEGRGGDGGLVGGGQRLRAMRWYWNTFKTMGLSESWKRNMDEIETAYVGEAESGGRWEIGVALGAACHTFGFVQYLEKEWKNSIAMRERALRLQLDTLGEQHPFTAVTLQNLGVAYSALGSHDTAIMFLEWALRIKIDTLGLHPSTADTLSNLGAAYNMKRQHNLQKKAIELFEQALCIYERTVGRMMNNAGDAIINMSTSYGALGEWDKAEQLTQEAIAIYTKTLGQTHESTKEARDQLLFCQSKRLSEFRK